MTFSVGDKVVYKAGDNWDGSIGTIVETNCMGFTQVVHSVSWETGRAWEYQQVQYPGRGFMRNYSRNLHPLEPKYEYDPNQTGDTEDDI